MSATILCNVRNTKLLFAESLEQGFMEFVFDTRKIFEFHLARWASNSQLLLVRGTYPLAQVFKLINNS